MMYHYVAKVGFDDRYADVVKIENYFDFMTRFNAVGIGSDRDGTSHLIFNSDKKLDKKQISKELGGLEVLTLNISDLKAA
jgi:hypothetical protein